MSRLSRRRFVAAASAAAGLAAPGLSRAAARPVVSHGVQSGDLGPGSGMIWARADRASRMLVEVSTTESFVGAVKLPPLPASPETDFAVKRRLSGLPADQEIFYRVRFEDLAEPNAVSAPVTGRFRTPPATRRSVKFVWGGDTAGQGWGIDESRGGMATYRTMAAREPDFFIHSGDTIYADNAIEAEKPMPGGGVWRNLVAEGVEKVAETLDEFRGRWKYNLLDRHCRAFHGAVPTLFQWDDHEVVNNWSPSKSLRGDDRYRVKDVGLLAARAGRAFHEMTPIAYTPEAPGRVYRSIAYGPLLEVFIVDLRSYRGPNGAGRERRLTDRARVLGRAQTAWLKGALKASRARWKVIASDMPIGLVVWDDFRARAGVEAVANGDDGAPRGRELEFAELLRFARDEKIRNLVWLTADVHYAAAHYYDPNRAAFQEFDPFWEFVAGPLHAGTFGPNALDGTFGPEVRFAKTPPAGQFNLPPSAGQQFFGEVQIDGATEQMAVSLVDRGGAVLHQTLIDPA